MFYIVSLDVKDVLFKNFYGVGFIKGKGILVGLFYVRYFFFFIGYLIICGNYVMNFYIFCV